MLDSVFCCVYVFVCMAYGVSRSVVCYVCERDDFANDFC